MSEPTNNNQRQPNPYLKLDREDYWQQRPDWYKDRHRMGWYESIDLNALAADTNPDLVDKLIRYTRTRDQVIHHRESVAFHVGSLLRFVLGSHEGTQYTPAELNGILKMIREYLIQMQVISATDHPDAPTRI
ncbi:MAG TPA: hypothetical protein VHL11_15855 [Phototrophicaceae bacterium]|jgi:hypothetical protein|nr:hypothetical protein [Phototrophicaceae bacterium]